MISQPVQRFRVGIAVGMAVAVSLTAACNNKPTPAAAEQPIEARFDKSLQDLLPAEVRSRGVLRIATDASSPPMEIFAPDGRTIIGVEPDLATEIGRVLGLKVEIVNTNFSELLDKVKAGEFDLAISGISDTEERAKSVDFVNYFSSGISLVVQRGNPAGVTKIEDLCGKIVAVEKGTTHEELLQRTQQQCADKPITVKSYKTSSDPLVELRTGRAAAALNDFPLATSLVSDPQTRSHYELATITQYDRGLYGIVIAKEQPGLRDAVKGAAEQLLAGGIYTKVLTKWGVREGAVDAITINSNR